MNKQIAVCLITLGFAAACVQGVSKGSVIMKISDVDAHISLGNGEVRVGDNVSLYHNECSANKRQPAKSSKITCERVHMGDGSITEILDANYSVASFARGTNIREGDTVEVKRRTEPK
jgi:hypothetical protein